MKLEPGSDKSKFKIVRTDDYKDVPGEIVEADEETGECVVSVPKIENGLRAIDADGKPVYENKSLNFGAGGIRVCGRAR